MNEIDQLKRLREGLPGPREEARESARAALMERADSSSARPARRRRFGLRAVALAGAACLATAAILIAIGSAGGPSVKPEVADAAQLRHLATVFPRLQIAGTWQIQSTEGSGEEGRMTFRYEPTPTYEPIGGASTEAEIRWYSVPEAERRFELLAEGFSPAGHMRVRAQRPVAGWILPFKYLPVEVSAFVSGGADEGMLDGVALWHEGVRTFELHAQVVAVSDLWRLAERVEILGKRQWLIALKPGGGPYLAESSGGLPSRVERVKIGEKPNGEPIYEVRGYVGAPGQGEKLKFRLPAVTTIYREEGKVRVVVTSPPR